jgi:mitochondrial import inner membrane translocase subunit TIM10
LSYSLATVAFFTTFSKPHWVTAIAFSSLTQSCTKKCIPPDYREGDLNKGESVCLDRCVAKFFEVNIKVSEKMQGEAAGKQGGMGFGV